MMDGMNLVRTGLEVFEAEGLRYLCAAGAVTLFLLLTQRWTARTRIQARRASASDVARELGHSLQTVTVFGLAGMLILALMQAKLVTITLLPASLARGLFEAVLILLAHDAYFYWMHRAIHSRRLFRAVHGLHHRSRTPTAWASYSFSLIEAAAEAAFLPLFLLAVPFSLPVLLFFLVHQVGRNALGHSGHELMPSGFTRHWATRWLTTTTHHDLHHSHARSNFGLYFTWWDRLMGTEHPRYHELFERAALPWLGARFAVAAASAEPRGAPPALP